MEKKTARKIGNFDSFAELVRTRVYDDIMRVQYMIARVLANRFGEDNIDLRIPDRDAFLTYIMGRHVSGFIPKPWWDKWTNGDTDGLPAGVAEAIEDLRHYIGMSLLKICDMDCRNFVVKRILVLDGVAGAAGLGSACFHDMTLDQTESARCAVMVHMPMVRITNEYGRYTDAKDFYINVPLTLQGGMRGSFTVNRSTYTMAHLAAGYMHSHVSRILVGDTFGFHTPCLGSGPINGTMFMLYNVDWENIDEEELMGIWELFAVELDLYMHTESVKGVPFRRLDNINASIMNMYAYPDTADNMIPYLGGHFDMREILAFTAYLLKRQALKFRFINGAYTIGMSKTEYAVTVSGIFIDWYNEMYVPMGGQVSVTTLFQDNVVKAGSVADGKIYFGLSTFEASEFLELVGQTVCRFKGRDVPFVIEDNIPEEERLENFVFLNPSLLNYILRTILEILNLRYGKEKGTRKRKILGIRDGMLGDFGKYAGDTGLVPYTTETVML